MKGRTLKRWISCGLAAAMLLSTAQLPTGTVQKVEAAEQSAGADGTTVTLEEGLRAVSPDGTLAAQIMKDGETGRYYYTVEKNGKTVIEPSRLGIKASTDFTEGLAYVEGSMKQETGTESYDRTTGASRTVTDPYTQISFDLAKKDDSNRKITVTVKVFNGGVGYRYTLYGAEGTTESISGEAGEFVFPGTAVLWTGNSLDVNYEFDYTKQTMAGIKSKEGKIPFPVLVNNDGSWMLIAESGVYNDEDPYCASYLKTTSGSSSLQMTFGNKQIGNVTKKYRADGTFCTPWRTAAVADNLNDIVGSTVFTSLNPDADPQLYEDTSYIKTGKVAWSWWSESGDDPVEYDQQKDYIDFAAENGWEYVCVDFGWCLWKDYEAKVKELADYAAEKNVGIILWYGVNNANHAGFKDAQGQAAYPKYSLKTTEQLNDQFAWCKSVGVKGVKVDYYESDNQATMRQMYECATIAAENELCVLFHGCNVPSGEQRTFPNVLGYEAVRGAEWFKWNVGSTVVSQLTYLYTRNVLGGMDYTPPAVKIAQLNTTAGYQLAQVVAYESGFQNIASSVYKLEGYAGLSLINDAATQWDETKLLDGYPGEHLTVARRSGDNWFFASMTAAKRDINVKLDFLGEGDYNAYLYKDNADGSDIAVSQQKVTRETVLPVSLLANGGIAIEITKEEKETGSGSGLTFYEAERDSNILGGNASVVQNQFVSGMKRVTGIGNGKSNTLTFTDIEVPEDGVYTMRLYFSMCVARRICYRVNEAQAIRTKKLNCGVNALCAEDFYVELKAGKNTITFFNEETKAPDVDRIAISKAKTSQSATVTDTTDDGIQKVDGMQYDYTDYGAGQAALSGGARIEGGGIGWLGNGENCTATYKVQADEAGTYKLRVDYYAGEGRNLQYKINGGTAVTLSCPSTGSYDLASAESIYADVALVKGENTITFFNASGWAPNIAGIGISKTVTDDKKDTVPDKNKENKITVKETSYTKTYSAKAQIFTIGASVAAGKVTYASDNKSITVDKNTGKVTIKKKYVGKAVITITSFASGYKTATKKVTVTVTPKKSSVAKKSPKSKGFQVTFKKAAGAAGYELQYSTSKKFTKKATKTKRTTKTSYTAKKLKAKKTYYVRVRTYKKVSGTTIYSAWSKALPVKTKK